MPDTDPTLAHAIILSDHVIREAGTGKLSYIGSFQNLNSPRFPFTAFPFVVTPFLANFESPSDAKVALRIEEPASGHVLCSTAVDISFSAKPSRNEVFEVPLGTPPVNFTRPGTYKIVVLVNSEKVGERDLAVRSTTVTDQQKTQEIPESFLRGLEDVSRGRVVPLDDALTNEPSAE